MPRRSDNSRINQSRWYDASVGRWLSEDPIGFVAGDANPYRYCGNGPTKGTDPTGLIGEDWIIDTVAGQIVKIIVPGVGVFEGATALEDALAATGAELPLGMEEGLPLFEALKQRNSMGRSCRLN